MNRVRVASLFLIFAFVLAPSRGYAQGGPPGGTPGANQNLSTRVEALEALVATLGTRVSKLESGQVTPDDLVGTYVFQLLGIETNGAIVGTTAPRISTETSSALLTLNANGTVSFSGVDGHCTLFTFATGLVTCSSEPGSADPVPGAQWSVSNGKLVITEPGDETMEVLISAGGRVLIGGGSSTDQPNHGWSAIVVMVRLP